MGSAGKRRNNPPNQRRSQSLTGKSRTNLPNQRRSKSGTSLASATMNITPPKTDDRHAIDSSSSQPTNQRVIALHPSTQPWTHPNPLRRCRCRSEESLHGNPRWPQVLHVHVAQKRHRHLVLPSVRAELSQTERTGGNAEQMATGKSSV